MYHHRNDTKTDCGSSRHNIGRKNRTLIVGLYFCGEKHLAMNKILSNQKKSEGKFKFSTKFPNQYPTLIMRVKKKFTQLINTKIILL